MAPDGVISFLCGGITNQLPFLAIRKIRYTFVQFLLSQQLLTSIIKMMEHITKTEDTELYKSPDVAVSTVKFMGILCQSGNESIYERDLGDGGFTEQ